MATIAGAIRTLIVAANVVGTRAYRHRAADAADHTYPYVTFLPRISDTVALRGDARTMARTRLVQVDLWQRADAEDDNVIKTLTTALDGATLTADEKTWSCWVQDIQEVLDPDPDLVHHSITVSVTYKP